MDRRGLVKVRDVARHFTDAQPREYVPARARARRVMWRILRSATMEADPTVTDKTSALNNRPELNVLSCAHQSWSSRQQLQYRGLDVMNVFSMYGMGDMSPAAIVR